VTGVTAGNTNINYSLGGSCIATATVTIDPKPDAGIISGLADVCAGSAITLSETVSGGAWSCSNGAATISGGVVTGAAPGAVTVRYVVSNGLCSDTATWAVNVYPVPDAGIITGLSGLCFGAPITLSDAIPGGVWGSVSTGIATISASGDVTGVAIGADTITYTVSNPGCSATVSTVITVYDTPDPGTITGRSVVCAGAVFKLSDSVAGGVWSSDPATVATIIGSSGSVKALTQGTNIISYTVGSAGGSCSAVATYTVAVHALFTINTALQQVSCYGAGDGSISVTVNGGDATIHYLWFNNNVSSSVADLVPGQYGLNITETSSLCIVDTIFHITGPDSLHLSDTAMNDLCNAGTGSIITSVTGGTLPYTYHWPDNSTDSVLMNIHAGTYTVTVTDHNGCSKDLFVVVGNDTCNDLVIHNVITPNGDGHNDTWVIEGIENYPKNSVQVFDKWGDMVFEKQDYNNDWTGHGKSGALPDGTYYYLIKLNAKNLKGGKDNFTGSLLIKP
jgi:gliding motility-associated-like protein